MDFSKYLIVTDLDGTLFNREQRIPLNSLESLEYFKNNGGVFTFATGRDIMFIKRRFSFLTDLINAPAIMSNGSIIYDFSRDETLLSLTLKKALAIDIINRVNEKFPDAPFQLTLSNGFSVVNPDEHYFRRFEKLKDLVVYNDRFIVPDEEIVAVNFIDRNPDRIKCVAEYVEKLDSENEFEKVFSETFIYEMLPSGATKGNALNFLKDKYSGRKIIAAGDWYNDMSVLENSDIPVCPSNAADEIREFSKFVLCHCTDGIICDIVGLIEKGLI